MRTALITLATGRAYHKYANEMVASAKQHWPEVCPIVFTDNPLQIHETDACIFTEAKGYPGETLMRYHTFLESEALLAKFDQIFYCDADMLWVAPPNKEFLERQCLVATLHPGYYGRSNGTPETRRESTAFCNYNNGYFAGGFQGGLAHSYIPAMKIMRNNIDEDTKRGITAVWHDESHWNKFLADRQTLFTTLTPSYCYPEDYHGQWGWQPGDFTPILMALDKRKRQGRG